MPHVDLVSKLSTLFRPSFAIAMRKLPLKSSAFLKMWTSKTNELVSDNATANVDTMPDTVEEVLISKSAFLGDELCAKFVEAYFIITEREQKG